MTTLKNPPHKEAVQETTVATIPQEPPPAGSAPHADPSNAPPDPTVEPHLAPSGSVNTNNPHGFVPLCRSLTGGPGAATLPAHKIVGVTAHAIYIHDAVTLNGTGVKPGASIRAAAAGDPVYGISLIYGAASKLTDHLVIPGHMQLFEAQIDTITIAQLNMNAALVATDGDPGSGLSKHSLNGVAVTNTLAFKLINVWNVDNNAIGANCRVIVTINKSQFADQTAGV